MNAKKIIKIVNITVLALVLAFMAVVGGYVAYVAIQYYRIDDNIGLQIENPRENTVSAGAEYTLVSYNLGFGAYSPEYSFFMDTGVMNDGTEVCGKYAKGMSKSDVEKNVSGQLSVSKQLNADFYFFQEVDEKADRSYKINMLARAWEAFSGYSLVYAENFHTANLFYPFSDPIGKTDAGILTLSRYKT